MDPIPTLKAMAAAAMTAAAVQFHCGWPLHRSPAARASAGAVLAVGLGFFVGCWCLGLWPHWPPREDKDRLLIFVFPVLMIVELTAVFSGRMAWLVWLQRLIVAGGVARVLLHDTSYLAEAGGPGTREWTPSQTYTILAGLAAALAGAWGALVLLARRAPGRALPLALALTCAGAAVTIMLSGYASGGQMGLPLAAALAGVIVASLARAGPTDVNGVLGLGLVGLFALLVIGRFFGQLTTANAVLLFVAPLMCWLPELPPAGRMRPWLRGVARVGLTAIPVVVALTMAQQKFTADFSRPSPGSNEPSLQDYMDFGK